VPDLQLDWTAFRGTTGQGTAAGIPAVLPGVDEGAILWKTEIDLPGKASPIAKDGYVFLSAADERTRKVVCFAAATGKKLWEQKVGMIPGAPSEAPELYEDDTGGTSFAAPTPAAGAGTVFSIFATGDLVAYQQGGKGKQKWAMNLGAPANMYGHSTSLLMADGNLIVQYDQEYGEDEEGNAVPKSVLLAKDPNTGQDVWRTVRPVGASWASPILADTPSGKQIITAGNPWVMAHDPVTGEEIWRAKLLYGDVAPSPAYADGLVFVAMDGAGTFAIRTDGTGDVSETHVAWKDEMATSPDIVSPVAIRDYLFTLSTYGQLTCFHAKTGDVVWENYFDASFNTSPLVVGEQGDELLLITTRGRMILIKIGEEFEQIADADLEENVYTTPAMGILPESGKPLLFVRGKKHLMCIGPAGALEIQEP
jgi:outer membrane protein assembly factor BamB